MPPTGPTWSAWCSTTRRPRRADFLQKNGDLWPAVADPGGTIAERYGITAPPTTFIINPAGRVSAVLVGPATQKNLDSFLKAAHADRAGASNG